MRQIFQGRRSLIIFWKTQHPYPLCTATGVVTHTVPVRIYYILSSKTKTSLLWFAESRVDITWFDSGVGTRMFNIAMKTRAWEYPSDNLYKDAITRRLDRQVHNAHRKRIKESRCMVDCHPPSTCGVRQLRHFAKKRQLKEGRELQIFSENSRHVDKLAQIINRQSGFCSSSSSIGGNMNNHHPPMKGDALFCKRSSIESARKKESERIAKDNQLLKDR